MVVVGEIGGSAKRRALAQADSGGFGFTPPCRKWLWRRFWQSAEPAIGESSKDVLRSAIVIFYACIARGVVQFVCHGHRERNDNGLLCIGIRGHELLFVNLDQVLELQRHPRVLRRRRLTRARHHC